MTPSLDRIIIREDRGAVMLMDGGKLLNQRVLVLNRHWIAVHVCSVRRALSLVFQELACVVTDDYKEHDFTSWCSLSRSSLGGAPVIRATTFSLNLPQVIVLSRYNRIPPRSLKFNRRNVFLRDRHTCQYCGVTSGDSELTIDHVIPRSRGGATGWDNLVVACTCCNTRIGNKLPQEVEMFPRCKPRKLSWVSALYLHPIGFRTPKLWTRFLQVSQVDLQPGEE